MDYKGTKSYSFIALYLMGLERHVLERDFFEDYTYSGGLTTLDNIEDARIIRYSARIRQKIYRNYSQYRSASDFEEVAVKFFDSEVKYLKERGIDLGQAFRSTFSIISVVNKLTEVINQRVPKVLKLLKFPYPEQVESIFYMFDVTDKSLDKYIKTMQPQRSKFPYMLFITRNTRLGTYISHFFQNDKTFIIGCHHLADVPYDLNALEIPVYDWNLLADEKVVLPVNQSTHFYVDCDNVSYFTFIGLLECLKASSKVTDKHIFNLYIDETTSPLWKMTSHIEHPLFQFNIIEVDRVKYTKSVVDVVIVAHIAQNSMIESALPPIILSSDSDYIGLIQAGIPIDGVFYELSSVNTEYVHQLKRQKVKHFNIGSLASDKFKQQHENIIIRQMVLEYLPTIPMVEWTLDNIVEYILNRQTDIIEYEIQLTQHNVVYQVTQMLEAIEIKLVDGKPTIVLPEPEDVEDTSRETVAQ